MHDELFSISGPSNIQNDRNHGKYRFTEDIAQHTKTTMNTNLTGCADRVKYLQTQSRSPLASSILGGILS